MTATTSQDLAEEAKRVMQEVDVLKKNILDLETTLKSVSELYN